MKIFIIHSGKDENCIRKIIKNELEKKLVNPELLLLNNVPFFWKHDASVKIKQANLVLFFVGETSSQSKNIDWEIKAAIKYGKEIYIVKLNENNKLNSTLLIKNEFSGQNIQYGIEKTLPEFIEIINNFSNKDYGLFNNDNTDINTLFEQYKIFLQTSESVVTRRQNVSNFYLSVNSAIVGFFGAIGALGIESMWKYYISITVPLVGIILCYSWINIINAYGSLNASKMKIINIIEKRLPASLYEAEWKVQTDKLNLKPYISFTKSETRIPKVFGLIYIIILLVEIIQYVIFLFRK